MALTCPGRTAFEQHGPAAWGRRGWELDTLSVPMIGYVDELDGYLATLGDWSPSSIDGAMFLESASNDNHPQSPTVTLHYIGRKRGILPRARHDYSPTLQTATWQRDEQSLEITYFAPTVTATIISKVPETEAKLTPPDLTTMQIIAVRLGGGADLGVPVSELHQYLGRFFYTTNVTVPHASELVPQRYWQIVLQTSTLLFPLSTS